MDYIKDALYVNRQALERTFESKKYFPIVVVILLFNMVINLVANYIISLFSSALTIPFLWGIVRYLVNVATLSLLVVALYKVMRKDRLSLDNFTDDWQVFINPLMSTMFIFWLIEMVISMITGPIQASFPLLSIILIYAYEIFTSPMLETVYIEGEQGERALFSIIDFLKVNFIQWIPVTVFFSLIMVQISRYSNIFAISIDNLASLPMLIIYHLLMAFIYIYKGHLYTILSGSSMRRRQFMKEADDDYFG